MNSIRSILSRAALAGIVSMAGWAQIARADRYCWPGDPIEQADCNLSAAQQALDAARSQQCSIGAAYESALSRVNADQQRVEPIDRAIASLNDNLWNANREGELRRYAIGTIQQRRNDAAAAAQQSL